MSIEIRCGDPAALAGYLYEDCDPAEREAMILHLAACASCTGQIESLRATRQQLSTWTPPDAQLGFRVAADAVVRGPVLVEPRVLTEPARGESAREESPSRWWHWAAVPAWAQAAAAVMLFACGATVAALMNLEMRYDQAGVTLRTGWQRSSVEGVAAPSAPASANAIPVSTVDAASLDSRIREAIRQIQVEEESGKGVVGAPVNAGTGTAMASNEMLRRVREMVTESEGRQQRELALRMAQLVRDVDSQRRADIARIERTVGPMEGVTTEEIQQQRRMLNYLMNVSQTK